MKISIVTAVLNDAAHLEETIRSVFAQEYPDLEYVIIDGGSSDGTVEIIRRYADRLAWWVSEPDSGIYEAMNKGIRRTGGEVIGIINSGDRYLPGAFAAVAETFAGQPGHLANGIFWGDVIYESCGLVRGFRLEKLKIGAFAPHPSMFVPRGVYERIGLYDERMKLLGDYDFMYRAVNYCGIVPLYRAVPVAFYRSGGLSDRRIFACLRDELTVKLRYGQSRFIAGGCFVLKVLKNLPRMLVAGRRKKCRTADNGDKI